MALIVLALQGIEKTDIVLGKTGTLLALAYGLMQTLISGYFFYKSREATELRNDNERARNATAVAASELAIHKEASERKTKELTEAHQTIGELKAKTDLSAVLSMLSETITLNRESVDLSRKFDRENAQLNANIVKALEKHGESDVQIFGEIRDSLANLVSATTDLKDEISDHRKDAKAMVDGVLKKIDEKLKPHRN